MYFPLVLTLDSARHAMCAHGLQLKRLSVWNFRVESTSRSPSRKTARNCLVLLFASFLAAALTRQRFFYPLSFAGLQIERVTFYFLDYVLGLYLPLKPAKCVFQRFSLLKPYFSQRNYTPLLALTGQ